MNADSKYVGVVICSLLAASSVVCSIVVLSCDQESPNDDRCGEERARIEELEEEINRLHGNSKTNQDKAPLEIFPVGSWGDGSTERVSPLQVKTESAENNIKANRKYPDKQHVKLVGTIDSVRGSHYQEIAKTWDPPSISFLSGYNFKSGNPATAFCAFTDGTTDNDVESYSKGDSLVVFCEMKCDGCSLHGPSFENCSETPFAKRSKHIQQVNGDRPPESTLNNASGAIEGSAPVKVDLADLAATPEVYEGKLLNLWGRLCNCESVVGFCVVSKSCGPEGISSSIHINRDTKTPIEIWRKILATKVSYGNYPRVELLIEYREVDYRKRFVLRDFSKAKRTKR